MPASYFSFLVPSFFIMKIPGEIETALPCGVMGWLSQLSGCCKHGFIQNLLLLLLLEQSVHADIIKAILSSSWLNGKPRQMDMTQVLLTEALVKQIPLPATSLAYLTGLPMLMLLSPSSLD